MQREGGSVCTREVICMCVKERKPSSTSGLSLDIQVLEHVLQIPVHTHLYLHMQHNLDNAPWSFIQ